MASPSELLPLRDGLTVPADIVAWLIRAEDKGLRFRVLPDHRLHVGPREALDPDDTAFIQQHRDLLRDAVTYIARMAEAPL